MTIRRWQLQIGFLAAHVDLIKPYLGDEEWWLRTAAFAAFDPLIADTAVCCEP